ncbi:MAG: dienelactone hydrolase family protein [Bacteroidales bacterium]|jgi:pimeloyl-ACP methyl ester carboxylesterase|nr:dienelactone hydrolase family protein [Bacteroidales bacterium]
MEEDNRKKILYLHGLDSTLSKEKRVVMRLYLDVVAPKIDYRNTPGLFKELSKLIAIEKPVAIVGSSMGGCLAYYLAMKHKLPALCFNPALCCCPIEIDLPKLVKSNNHTVFVIGGKDNVVPAVENFEWIRLNANSNFELRWYNKMAHRVDVKIFKKEVERFLKRVLLRIIR